MTIRFQILLVAFCLFCFCSILRYIRKSKLNADIAVVWIIWGIGLIILSLFPDILTWTTSVLGIMTPMNTLYLIMIFLLYCLVFYLCIRLSILEDKFKNLTQHVAIKDVKKEDDKE